MKSIKNFFGRIKKSMPAFYVFDPAELLYKKATKKLFGGILLILSIGIITGVFLISPIILSNFGYKTKVGTMVVGNYEFEPMVTVVNKDNVFTKAKLIDYLKELNVMHPEIVLAQAEWESANFTSQVFKENNNLFGMKQAMFRATTAMGTQYNHAYYKNWKDCVLDYALYQNSYLRTLDTAEEYFSYLQQYYATDPNYVVAVRKLINRENLAKYFN